MRHPLFSIRKNDLVIQTFRSGGKGGQHQNKVETGVRIIHPDSGAVGESRNHRSQHRNKIEAFRRLAASEKLQKWIRMKAAEKMGLFHNVERAVEEQMRPENIRVEVLTDRGWKEAS